jgi:hypothetical protein
MAAACRRRHHLHESLCADDLDAVKKSTRPMGITEAGKVSQYLGKGAKGCREARTVAAKKRLFESRGDCIGGAAGPLFLQCKLTALVVSFRINHWKICGRNFFETRLKLF